MKHTYQLDTDDYLRFYTFLRSRSPWYQRISAPVIMFPIVIAIILAASHCALGKALLIFFISTQCWAGFIRGHERSTMIAFLKGRAGVVGEFTATMTAEMIAVDTIVYNIQTPWASFIEITQSQNYLVFLLTPTHGFVIPKASFGHSEYAKEFLAAARAYRNGESPSGTSEREVWHLPPRIG